MHYTTKMWNSIYNNQLQCENCVQNTTTSKWKGVALSGQTGVIFTSPVLHASISPMLSCFNISYVIMLQYFLWFMISYAILLQYFLCYQASIFPMLHASIFPMLLASTSPILLCFNYLLCYNFWFIIYELLWYNY